MKTIAIITPTLANGGAERIISTLSQSQILKEKYLLKIITFDSSSNDYPFDCEIIDLSDRYSKELSAIKPLKYINYIKIINKVKKEMNFDIVISFMENMGIVNAFTKKHETAIHVVSSYLSGQYKYSNRIQNNLYVFLFRLLIRIFFNKLDGILAISQESRLDLIQKFHINSVKIIVSYNPYNIKLIKNMAGAKNSAKHKNIIRITNMGSLIDVKAQWNLLRVFKIIEKSFSNIELLFIGRGENEKYLKDMTAAYGLNEKVLFIGYVTNPFEYLNTSDIYVLSSKREGLPNALIEAMACGLPVIATDCSSGPREILAPKTNFQKKATIMERAEFGILVPINNGDKKTAEEPLDEQEKILKQAIELLIKDGEIRNNYSRKSVERSLDFNIDNIIKRWIEAIELFNHEK